MTRRVWIALLAIAILAAPVSYSYAQVLYKWIGDDGTTQYSDRLPPKSFKGTVMRIEPDEQPPPAAPYRVPGPNAKQGEDGIVHPPDVAGARRDLRRKLEADVAAARERLVAAKLAAEVTSAPQDDEKQTIQRRTDQASNMPGAGSTASGGGLGFGRSNCTTAKNADGRPVTTCPAAIPNDAYYERIRKLEDDVRAAEENLATAERAYRRGAD
ncbi:MAG TPA: DUF4124 domain-containing protein [Usitatibacter sp.]